MRMKQRKSKKLNDGYAAIYNLKDKKMDFSVKEAPKSLNDLEFFVNMAYEEQYKREQDYEFAESIGNELTLKIKTLLYEDITKRHKVEINDVLYNIIKIDYDRANRVMYLYLEEERKIAK